MIEKPDIILIEWRVALANLENTFTAVRWSRIPKDVYKMLEMATLPMVLHWDEQILRDLYSTFDATFEEFAMNTNSLIADRLPAGSGKTVFIFGTRRVLIKVKKSITDIMVPPHRSFSYMICPAVFTLKGDTYFVRQPEGYGPLIFQQTNYLPNKNFLRQPHPK
jgi:hypothetical protein